MKIEEAITYAIMSDGHGKTTNQIADAINRHGWHQRKDGKTYRIPDKRTQSLQAYKSGLSYKGKDIDFNLTNPEPGFFEMEAYIPFFREHCKTCGSRMTCNGCSNCGNCDKDYETDI